MSDALRTATAPPSNLVERGTSVTPHTESALSPALSPALTPAVTRARRTPGSALRHVGARFVYWTPVLVSLCLFAQVAFLGLRPAISEARRLADASDMLEARWSEDRGLYDAYELQLRVRQDPIFVERQRRLRRAVPASPSSGF